MFFFIANSAAAQEIFKPSPNAPVPASTPDTPEEYGFSLGSPSLSKLSSTESCLLSFKAIVLPKPK